MSPVATDAKPSLAEIGSRFAKFAGSREWPFAISQLTGPQRITACLPSSRDWGVGTKESSVGGRTGPAPLRRDPREELVAAAKTAPSRQAESTRDLLRLVQQEAEASRELIQLRREVEELKHAIATMRGARPRIDLQQVIRIHGLEIPVQLRGVSAALEDSRILLELEDDWDGNGACGYAEQTWQRAAGFLVRSATALAAKYGVFADEVEILPGAEGALNIDWRHSDRELLIIVPEDPAKEARFYGDDGHGGEQIKSTLDTSKTYDWLATWLTE